MIVFRLGLGHVGDVACAMPAIAAVRATGEEVGVDVHPAHRAPFGACGFNWGKHPDARALSLPRSAKRPVDAWLDAVERLGYPVDRAARPAMPVRGAERAARLMPGDGWVVLAPWSDVAAKAWRDAAGWAAVAGVALAAGYRVALIGPERAASMAGEIAALNLEIENLVGMDTPETWPAMVARAAVAVAPDGGTVHVADLLGVPVVALFGPTDPEQWGPYWDRRFVVSSETKTTAGIAVDDVRTAMRRALEER